MYTYAWHIYWPQAADFLRFYLFYIYDLLFTVFEADTEERTMHLHPTTAKGIIKLSLTDLQFAHQGPCMLIEMG